MTIDEPETIPRLQRQIPFELHIMLNQTITLAILNISFLLLDFTVRNTRETSTLSILVL
jgi:hypothetical protein